MQFRGMGEWVSGSGTHTDRANNRRVNLWSILWAGSLMAASALLNGLELPVFLQWVIGLLPTAIAIGALRAYLRLLRMTDELQRQIHLEGLAIGFGASYIFVMGYVVTTHLGLPPMNPVVMVLVMTISWILGTVFAVRRYR